MASDSILTSIKLPLGIQAGYSHFDDQIMMHINGVFMTLNELAVGPEEGFVITGEKETWSDFFGNETDKKLLSATPTYVYQKVRLVFDPPTSSFVIASFEKQIAEYEWRANVRAEGGSYT